MDGQDSAKRRQFNAEAPGGMVRDRRAVAASARRTPGQPLSARANYSNTTRHDHLDTGWRRRRRNQKITLNLGNIAHKRGTQFSSPFHLRAQPDGAAGITSISTGLGRIYANYETARPADRAVPLATSHADRCSRRTAVPTRHQRLRQSSLQTPAPTAPHLATARESSNVDIASQFSQLIVARTPIRRTRRW